VSFEQRHQYGRKWRCQTIIYVPDSEHLWLFTGSSDVRLSDQTADVRDGSNGGGNEPRESEDGADGDQDGNDEKIQMVTVTFLNT